jgi:hypothetical protein
MKSKIYRILLVHFDKVCHALLGTIFYAILSLFFVNLYALIATVILAIGIEIYDYISKKGTLSVVDAIATVVLPIILYFN